MQHSIQHGVYIRESTMAQARVTASTSDEATPSRPPAAVGAYSSGHVPTILALDFGTSGAKAALIATTGDTVATALTSYETHTIKGGGVEQDPHEWIAAARTSIAQLMELNPHASIGAVSMTGQMQDLIRIDANNEAIDNAILYSDTRARAEAAEIKAALPEWDEITGNIQVGTSSAASWLRLSRELANKGESSKTAHLLFSPTGYVAAQLGCGTLCDETTASTTGLLDISTGTWSQRICDVAGVDMSKLPTIRSGRIGTTHENNVLGVPAGIPVILSPGDAATTTCGMVGLSAGDDYVSFGTSGWHAQVMDRLGDVSEVQQLLLPGGKILSIAAVLSVGGVADWARKRFLGDTTAQDADRIMLKGNRGPTGMIATPSIHGERFPIRDDDMGAAIIDIHPHATNEDLFAAVLEGVCLSLSHNITGDAVLAATGGGSRSLAWMRMLADITGRTIRITSATDASLHGAACFAARELGWAIIEPLRERAIIEVEPEPENTTAYAPIKIRHRKLFEALSTLPTV